MKQQAVSIAFSLMALGTTLISGCAPDMTDTVQRLSNQYKGREEEKKSKNNPSISNQQKRFEIFISAQCFTRRTISCAVSTFSP